LIVFAVKICKQCLQTASASGWTSCPDLLPGRGPLGDFRTQDPVCSPPIKIPVAATVH